MLQDHPLWRRFTARLHIIVATLVALVAAVVFGLSAGAGDFSLIGMGLGLAFLLAIMNQMGSRYWLVIPFAFVSQLAAIPVGGKLLELPEVVTFVCLMYFLVQLALKKQKFTFFRKGHVPVQLYAAWALVVFMNNPVGLNEMGSSLGGLRFYGKIGLALIAFLLVANQEVGERECKWVLIIFVSGAFLASAQEVFFLFFPRVDSNVLREIDEDSFYTWHQVLSVVPLLMIQLLFSRYRSSQIFSFHRIWLLGLFLACVGMVVLSGKRGAVASVPFFAVAAAFMRREFGFLFLWLVGAGLACAIVIVGHGELFHLSLTAQRALSFLPARWDVEIASVAGGKDDFRDMLRLLAREKIQRDPWVGTGYKIDNRMMEMALTKAVTGIEDQVLPYALGSAWHNTWLGYAADFGIPASILVGIIFLWVLYGSWTLFRASPPNSLTQTLAFFIFLFTFRDVVFSNTGGHSALDAYARWWVYGLLVALTLTNRQRQAAQPPSTVLARGRAVDEPAFAARPAGLPATAPRPSRF